MIQMGIPAAGLSVQHFPKPFTINFSCITKALLLLLKIFRMKTRHIVLIGFILMLVMMGVTLINNANKFELVKNEKTADTKRYVNVIKTARDSSEVIIEGQGRISSSRKVDVSAEVQGMLIPGKILKAGSTVQQGELLFQVRDNDARLSLQARKSGYLNLLANVLPDLRLDYPDVYNDWKKFFDNIDIARPMPELPVVKSSREKSFLASKNIFGEYYAIRSDEERIKKYSIAAPFEGTITEVYAEPGAVVNPGAKLLSLIKSNDLEIEIPVDVKNIGWIKKGAQVELRSTSGPARYKGSVVRIGEFVNVSSQSVPVFIRIEKKPDDVLYNGMYLTALIRGGSVPNTIELPRRAVFDDHFCYEVKDSMLLKKELHIEFVTRESVIASGVTDNSLLVIEPLSNVKDSLRVTPIVKK